MKERSGMKDLKLQKSVQATSKCCFKSRPFASLQLWPVDSTRGSGAKDGRFGFRLSEIDLVSSKRVQPRLILGPADDKYEREADLVARRVMDQQDSNAANQRAQKTIVSGLASRSPPVPTVQRQVSSFPDDSEEKLEEEKRIQRKGKAKPLIGNALEQRLSASAGSGGRLPQNVQVQMENSFGASLDRVRIHANRESGEISRSLNAEAFTYGNDIYFGANRYNLATNSGIELLAHELTHTLQQTGVRRKMIQRRGGPAVGQLSIKSNVVNQGLVAGHAWLSYTPVGGSETTYGTWGNREPVGLHRNLELSYTAAASRTAPLDNADHANLASFAAANNSWGYINNCASFAARGWRAVTGESLSHTWMGIPNPSSLGAGILSANGGMATGTQAATAPVARPSSGSSAGSSGGSSTGSSGGSSSSSL